jgi:hypothetical protein
MHFPKLSLQRCGFGRARAIMACLWVAAMANSRNTITKSGPNSRFIVYLTITF